MKVFKIAVLQMRPRCRQVEYNLEKAARYVTRAVKKGAGIVCLPELFDTGYDLPWVKKNADKTSLRTIDYMLHLAHDQGVFIIGGVANRRGGELFNSSFIFGPKGRVAIYDKNYLFRARPQEEHKYFREAGGVNVVETLYGKVGFAICNDIRYPELFGRQAHLGAKIIFVSSAWSYKRRRHWETLLKARAIENQAYIVASNQDGMAGKLRLAGNSMIVDYDGEVLSRKVKGEGLIYADIDYKSLNKKRKELPTLKASHEKKR